jgi:hypothetical protein
MPTLLAPIGYCLAELARERGRVFALLLALLPLVLFYARRGARRARAAVGRPGRGRLAAAGLLVFGAAAVLEAAAPMSLLDRYVGRIALGAFTAAMRSSCS